MRRQALSFRHGRAKTSFRSDCASARPRGDRREPAGRRGRACRNPDRDGPLQRNAAGGDRRARDAPGRGRARRPGARREASNSFLHEYGLSSEEGILLLCLAEALLRIPDAATADRLIAGAVGSGDWSRHLGQLRLSPGQRLDLGADAHGAHYRLERKTAHRPHDDDPAPDCAERRAGDPPSAASSDADSWAANSCLERLSKRRSRMHGTRPSRVIASPSICWAKQRAQGRRKPLRGTLSRGRRGHRGLCRPSSRATKRSCKSVPASP